MKIGIKIDSTQTLKTLAELGESRQGPFILARGLNLIAKQVQTALRDNLASGLKLTRTTWIKQQVKINTGQWATKTRLVVRIELTPEAAFLAGFEGGEDHIPGLGRKFLAIPNPKVFGSKPIMNNNIFKVSNLALHQTPRGLEGNQRTFVLHTKATHTALIMQEVSPGIKKGFGKKGVNRYFGNRILYTLVRHSKRPNKIAWANTARVTAAQVSQATLAGVLKAAIADAKAAK